MSRPVVVNRRQLLVSVGSGVLGIAVLGTVGACSGAGSPDGGPPGTSGTAGSASARSSGAGTTALAWQRVSLSFVSAYVLVRGSEAAVVDTGTENSADAIGTGVATAGVGWDAVRHVVLTHKHADHAGGLSSVQPQAANATIYAGRDDLAEITAVPGGKPLSAVTDGAEIFGLRIVGTPGHTARHISVFDPTTGVLVAGDALRTTDGLQASDPQYTADPAAAAASVKKLAGLDVRVILPGHGEPLTSGASEALKKLAASLATA